MELIPGPETDPAILADVEQFADRRLGKGVVRTKDTPNFIANRIGSFLGGTIGKAMVEEDFSIEEVDALTGPLIGVPNSASFRLLDLVGLDVWGFVGTNLYELVPNDPWRERFLPLDFEKKMIERKWLGDKTGQGFYKKRRARATLARSWCSIGRRSNTSRSRSRGFRPSTPRATSRTWASASARCSAPTTAPGVSCGRC